MNTKIKKIGKTACGVIACVALIAAVSVTDGSTHEMAVRLGGAIAFAVFALAWAKLKEEK